RGGIGLAGADAHGAVEAEDEDLSVPDLTGFGGVGDGLDGLVDLIGRHRHLDLDLRQEAHGVFGAAVDFGMALLPPVALDLGHGHAVHADRGESVADLVELERLDDGHDDFDGYNPRYGPIPAPQVVGTLRPALPRAMRARPPSRIKPRARSLPWG